MYRKYLKRILDFILSVLVFLLASPVFLIVTLILAVTNKNKPFFVQLRPGKNGRIFKVIKFKTMTDEKDSDGNLISDEDRLTVIGSFVRKTSLDEIPQLLNVIKGDMSLIGPRPLLVQYLGRYNKTQARRHEVRPGITGLAQINGRNAISWKKKFEYDVWYVDNLSFWIDIKIIFKTIWKVFKSEGISQEGNATMEEFNGSK
ncbi:sugar transferase [Lutimonas halocynthiae]|uniref:sugar transferase n=1 Tax=Lutimonas halocynthiae TaxID=1446477 RepID=UPI0025B57DFD|nr:sugar transferase [Lutimonas halocynthiae]MDN3643797.1 sugar transferase [Lutimonas halocynthiae]